MAIINLGAIKFNWKGAYNNGTSYAVDDVVSSGGNSYVCIQAHSNQAVGDATAYWNIMSSKGTNGTDGTDVSATLANKEIAFKTNAGAVDGIPIGTAGQFLKVNSGATGYEYGAVSGGAFGQFVFADDGTVYSNTSTSSYVRATNTKIDITPSAAGKHIFVCFNVNYRFSQLDSSLEHRIIRIVGGVETTIRQSSSGWVYHYDGQVSANWKGQAPIFLTDNPNTASQVTYTIDFKNPNRVAATYINDSDNTQMMAYEIN